MIIGYGNAASTGPTDRAWCIGRVIIRPYLSSDPNNSANGEPGRTRLLENGKKLFADVCSAAECNDETKNFSTPHFAAKGVTLWYEFTCEDNPGTPDVDECTDSDAGGSTIEIQYDILRGS